LFSHRRFYELREETQRLLTGWRLWDSIRLCEPLSNVEPVTC